MSQQDQEKENKYANTRSSGVFWLFIVLVCGIVFITILPGGLKYLSLNCSSLKQWIGDWSWLSGWYIAGAVLSYIITLVTVAYFYEKFIMPYRQKHILFKSDYPNYFILMVQWFFPVLFLFVLIESSFFLTIQRDPFHQLEMSVYTHPYKYGLMFKELELNKDDEQEKAQILERYLKFFESGSTPASANNPKQQTKEGIELEIYKIPYLIAVAFSFLGSMIYILRDIARRFYTSDLYSKTLVNYIIRMLFSAALSLVIAFFVSADWWTAGAPLVFFFTGLIPQRALQFVESRSQNILGLTGKEKNFTSIDLTQIDGMTEYVSYRFKEIGIEDVNSLAFVDLKYLRTNLGFSETQLCDFVAQALLIIELPDDHEKLRKFGIRNICNFKEVVTKENYLNVAEVTKIDKEKFPVLMKILESGVIRKRIEEIERCCEAAAKNAISNMNEDKLQMDAI